MEALLGPSQAHRAKCKHCEYEDEDDHYQWFGLRKWLVLEKVNEDDLQTDAAAAAATAREQKEETCKRVSGERVEVRRQRLEAAKAASIAQMEAYMEEQRRRKLEAIEKTYRWKSEHPGN
jgi:hypothetical protein